MMGQSLSDIFQSIVTLPQTQKDIRSIAQAADQFQSPQGQQQLQQIGRDVQDYATVQLLLQATGTIAMVGILLINIRNMKR